jgi:broad specificity phosphatase PhoE
MPVKVNISYSMFASRMPLPGRRVVIQPPPRDIRRRLSLVGGLKSNTPDFRPRRIILLRHGQSLGNVDESAYCTTPDWRIPLTDIGRNQATDAGRRLRNIICEKDAAVLFYNSPYIRAKQTLDRIKPFFDDKDIVACLEEPRISEQQIGNFQNVQQILDAKSERSKFGRFFYRFPTGEAGLDVYSRVSSFIPTMVRDCTRYGTAGQDLDNLNVIIVTHGLALRFFLMRWFQFSVEDFELSRNPDNCELITMNKIRDSSGHGWMELNEENRISLFLPQSAGIPRNVHMHMLERQQSSSSLD